MKKRFVYMAIITVGTVITVIYLNLQLKTQSNNFTATLLSFKSIEALAAGETRCIVSSDQNKNTGKCKLAVNKEQGAVCVTMSLDGLPDCYGHETY